MFSNRLKPTLRLSAVRQALWLLGLFFVISLAGWGGTFLLVKREMLQNVDARLEARMGDAIAALQNGDPLPALNEGETSRLVDTRDRDGFETRDARGTETEMRYLLRTTPYGQVELGEVTELQEELQDILAGGMRLSLLATLVAAALAAIWMARRSQTRLNTINTGLAAVARGNLATRIALDGQDDLSLLAERINATTARLEGAMTQMRVQSSNIAHDLRTPLARLRAQIETSLLEATEQDRPVDPEVLSASLEQIDRITGTFEALLRLARIESGAGKDALKPVDLKDLAEEIAETFGPVVEDADQRLDIAVTDAKSVSGDRDLLVQLVANLIQNALRYGAERQTIALRVHGRRLVLTDEGPGIPFEHREHVLQPLFQGETSRQGDGYGIGLALVRAIAEFHGAELTLSDAASGRGLCVTLAFPELTEM